MKKVEILVKKRTVFITMGLLFSLFVSNAGAGLIGQRDVYIYACKEYATFYLTPPVGFKITDWDCINVESYDGGCDDGTYVDTTDNRLVIMVFSGGHTGFMGIIEYPGSYSATYRIYGYYVNSPPIADAGPDQTVEQENYDGIEVTLDGSGSTDPDSTAGTNDDIVSFDWYEGDTHLGSGETIKYTFPVGSHTVSLVVTDSFGETDYDEVIIGAGPIGQRDVYIWACKKYATFYLTPPVGFTITDWDCINVESYDGGCDDGTYVDTTDNRLVIMVFSGGHTGFMGIIEYPGLYIAMYRIYGYFYGNSPPTADADGPYVGNEGSPITFDGTGSFDTDGDPLTYDWDFGDSGTGTSPTPTHTYADNGTYVVWLTVTDSAGASDTQSTTAEIANVAPMVGPITAAPMDPIQVGTPIFPSAEFEDPGTADTHTAEWDWGDGSVEPGTVIQGAGFGIVGDPHTYTEAGIYTVRLTVTDDDGGSGESEFQYVIVYDPTGGFVTGGGWIWSPKGAYAPDADIEGRANLGFVSKYKKGAEVPTGNTEFQFHAGDLNFHSSSYEWLVVTGSDYARFKGTGTINGYGEYRFMLWAGDDPDTFRIRIWTEDEFGIETVEYDNGFDQAIGGGSIIIHTGKK